MSRQLQTTDAGDLEVSEGQLVIVTGKDSLAQSIGQRLKTSLGEWRYDLSNGVPYIQRLAGRTRDDSLIRAILSEVILETPGVVRIVRLELDLDPVTRIMTVGGEVQIDLGIVVPFAGVQVSNG
jgi:hypothetical protein